MVNYTDAELEAMKEALKQELLGMEEDDPELVREIEIIQGILDTRKADAYAQDQEN